MPMLSELDRAMQQPGLSVPALRRLGGGTIRRATTGNPLRATGRDNVVYELDAPDGRIWALRCPQRPDVNRDHGLAGRYAALAGDPYLAPLRTPGAPLPRDMQWIAEGISLTDANFHRLTVPVVVMERVPGRTLLLAVDRLCHEGQRDPLALLADAWLETAGALAAVGFVHGDLAADNIMVRPDGSLAVVDLDTASWPTAELPLTVTAGTPGYAHPRGAPRDAARADRFPALILWASLRILARHPHLRERWGDHPDRFGGTLLWAQDDLQKPGRSPLFATLSDLHDEALAPLLEVVRRAIQFPPDETPPLAEIAERLDALGVPRLASPTSPRRPTTPPPADSAPPQTSTEMPAQRSEPGAVAVARRGEPTPSGAPKETTTRLAKERRLAAAMDLRSALDARNTVKALQLWEEHRAIPEASSYAPAVHLLLARDAAAAIDRALRRGDDAGLVAAVASAERAGVAPSPESRTALRGARERIAAHGALREAIAQGDLDALARLATSGELNCLGRLQPEEARAVDRARLWPALDRALARDDDDAIVAATASPLWQDGSGFPLAARERVALAWARRQWASDVRQALRRRDVGGLRALLVKAPPGAEHRLTEVESRRILRVSVRDAAVARLERALREGPDREIVAALTEFESAGTPFTDVLDWVALRGVVDRVSLVEALRASATADPPDAALLARLLCAARAARQDRGGGQEPDWPALERVVLRSAHLARLREALGTGDPARIAAAAAPDPYDARSLLRPDERGQVERSLAQRTAQRGSA